MRRDVRRGFPKADRSEAKRGVRGAGGMEEQAHPATDIAERLIVEGVELLIIDRICDHHRQSVQGARAGGLEAGANGGSAFGA